MATTKIEWADRVWNVVTGCTKTSPGCQHCYAERMAKRLAGRYGYPKDEPFKVTLHSEKLDEPLHWKKPSRIFVCSMGDLFHNDVPTSVIAQVWNMMAWCATQNIHHQFIVLTKRPERMATLLSDECFRGMATFAECDLGGGSGALPVNWPLPNVWLGVTAENQEQADKRIPILLQIPAAKRFVSVEPMLSAIDLRSFDVDGGTYYPLDGDLGVEGRGHCEGPKLDWVICGGESGPGARPMHPDWVRSLRDQCQAAGTSFLFKQWGNYIVPEDGSRACRVCGCTEHNACVGGCYWVEEDLCSECIGKKPKEGDRPVKYQRVSKKKAGRLLDGKVWDEYPEEAQP